MSKGDQSDSQRPESLWLATTPETDYGTIEDGLVVDVAVVGGGITGLSTAINLTEAGKRVAVIEADHIVASTTGHTTAKLTSQHGLIYDTLISEFGKEKAQQYADANEAAIDEVQRRVEEHGIDCQFERTQAYTYAASTDDAETIHKEVRAAQRLGLPATFTDMPPLPIDTDAAVRFDDQAQFHPRKYLLALAELIDANGSYVFEKTRAMDIEAGSPSIVETEHGDIIADDIVVATHFPFFDRAGYFSRMHPKRAYLLAVRLNEETPKGMFYSTASPPNTIRTYTMEGNGATEELLIIGGQSHKPGTEGPPTSERYRRCEAFARRHFNVESVEYRWSTMDYSPVDQVPFVGKIDPLADNIYVGTGFNSWGMSGGVAAGLILSDLILSGSNQWTEVFDPQRFTPQPSAKKFVTENAVVGGNFVGDWTKALLSSDEVPTASDSAAVTRHDGQPMGIYRDEDGTVHAVSAVCPHMKCLVRWNDAERSWDCPCHGSRFTYKGDILSGPALESLPYQEL